MREIEIKLKVNNLEELENKLAEAGLIISKEVFQHDVVYTSTNEDYASLEGREGYIAIRIRRQDGKNILTLKKQLSHELDNLEYETKVENFETMNQILQLLGWKPVVEVKKLRKKGKLGEFEICLDRVEELGDYLELEKMADDSADPVQVSKELFAALAPFGLSEKDEEKRGYDTLMYLLKNKN